MNCLELELTKSFHAIGGRMFRNSNGCHASGSNSALSGEDVCAERRVVIVVGHSRNNLSSLASLSCIQEDITI